MPERVADAIEEIARPSRDDQQENPRFRLIRRGCAAFWVLGIDALDPPALAPLRQASVRVAVAVVTALVIGVLFAWLFRLTRPSGGGCAAG